MNKRLPITMILALAALLLAVSLAVAQPLPGKEPVTGYAVQPGTAAGGVYQLKGADWSVRGTASGGDYRLDMVNVVSGTGTPCCCTYLPCLLKGYR